MSLCYPLWKRHHWSPWMAVERWRILSQHTIRGVPIGDLCESQEISQERTCSRCGLLQRRRVSA